jgi:hypothetical protein
MKKWLFFLSLGMMVSFYFDSFSSAPAKINVYKRCVDLIKITPGGVSKTKAAKRYSFILQTLDNLRGVTGTIPNRTATAIAVAILFH